MIAVRDFEELGLCADLCETRDRYRLSKTLRGIALAGILGEDCGKAKDYAFAALSMRRDLTIDELAEIEL